MFPKTIYPPAGQTADRPKVVRDQAEWDEHPGWTDAIPEGKQTGRQYPKWKYPPKGSGKKPVEVKNEAEEGEFYDYFDSPADADAAAVPNGGTMDVKADAEADEADDADAEAVRPRAEADAAEAARLAEEAAKPKVDPAVAAVGDKSNNSG